MKKYISILFSALVTISLIYDSSPAYAALGDSASTYYDESNPGKASITITTDNTEGNPAYASGYLGSYFKGYAHKTATGNWQFRVDGYGAMSGTVNVVANGQILRVYQSEGTEQGAFDISVKTVIKETTKPVEETAPEKPKDTTPPRKEDIEETKPKNEDNKQSASKPTQEQKKDEIVASVKDSEKNVTKQSEVKSTSSEQTQNQEVKDKSEQVVKKDKEETGTDVVKKQELEEKKSSENKEDVSIKEKNDSKEKAEVVEDSKSVTEVSQSDTSKDKHSDKENKSTSLNAWKFILGAVLIASVTVYAIWHFRKRKQRTDKSKKEVGENDGNISKLD